MAVDFSNRYYIQVIHVTLDKRDTEPWYYIYSITSTVMPDGHRHLCFASWINIEEASDQDTRTRTCETISDTLYQNHGLCTAPEHVFSIDYAAWNLHALVLTDFKTGNPLAISRNHTNSRCKCSVLGHNMKLEKHILQNIEFSIPCHRRLRSPRIRHITVENGFLVDHPSSHCRTSSAFAKSRSV